MPPYISPGGIGGIGGPVTPPTLPTTPSLTLASVAPFLVPAAAGFVLQGIGSLLGGSAKAIASRGVEVSSVNPVAPWPVIYGRKRVGGTIIFINDWGAAARYLDIVVVLAAHPCQSVDSVYFNNRRVLINSTTHQSFSPSSGHPGGQFIAHASSISRVGGEVTVTLIGDIAELADGDQVVITQAPASDLNGTFPIQVINRTSGNLTFKYFSGGLPYSGAVGLTTVTTNWPDYGAKVYFEAMLGTQTLGQTFAGMGSPGTPDDLGGSANPPNLIHAGFFVQNLNNPWTADCSVLGKTCVFLRLHYDSGYFADGLPNISFMVHGKNDIFDPRTSTSGYTENAALCVADYLQNATWGFGASSSEINTAQLIAAANICDESVPLNGGGTEPRYACNGSFTLAESRGDILRDMLTSCAGRLTYVGGEFFIWPGAWFGTSGSVSNYGLPISAVSGSSIFGLATDTFRWRPTVSITETYNGVKGTFISPPANWVPTDFPAYAQDVLHGYSSDTNMAADGGVRRWLDVTQRFCISSSQAQRVAKIELLRRRQKGTGTFVLNVAGYQFAPLDVIQMDLSTFAWTGKYLEVAAVRLRFDKQQQGAVLLGTEIDVQETDPSIYAWSTTEELSPSGNAQAQLPDLHTPAPPTNVVISNIAGGINITWTPPDDGFVLNGGHIEIEYQIVASPEGLWYSLAKMDPSATTANITNLVQGDSYNVRIRSVNVADVASPWVIATPAGGSTPGPLTVRGPLPINPGWESPIAFDPLFQADGFGLSQGYTIAESGDPLPQSSIYGYPPVNVFSETTTSPVITNVTVGVGGAITGGKTYIIAVTAYDGSNPGSARQSRLSNFFSIAVPSGTGKQLLVDITWPAGSFGGAFWVAEGDDTRGFHFEGNTADAFGPTSGSVTENLAAISGVGLGPPDDEFDHCVFKVMRELVSGVFAQEAAAVTTNTISLGGTTTPNQFVGRVFSKLAHRISSSPVPMLGIQDYLVTANDGAGNFTVTPDPVAEGCLAGDLFTLRTAPTSATSTSFTDSLFFNPYNGGLTAHANAGNLAFVIAGKGAGQIVQTVVDNTGSTVTVSPGWDVIPDSTSVIVLVEAAAQINLPGNSIMVGHDGDWQGLLGIIPVPNYAGKVVRVEIYSADATGITGPQQTVPWREVYIWGAGGTREVFADTNQLITDGLVTCDTTGGQITYQCLPAAQAPNTMVIIQKVSSDANAVVILPATGEAFEDGTTTMSLLGQGDSVTLKFHGG